MKSILVTTDFSRRSDPAISRGAALAKMHNAELTLAHIVDDDQSERLADAAQREAAGLLDALTASLHNEHGISAKIVVTRGEPHTEILQVANEVKADIIVIGSHRRNILRNTFIGTTAERSIRSSNLPVLIARGQTNDGYKRPAIALDLAEGDLTPLTTAVNLGLFEIQSAKIIFAYDAGSYHLLRQSGATDRELKKYFDEEESKLLPGVARLLDGAEVELSQATLKPALFNDSDTILETALAENADIIIVGARRKTTFNKIKLGSVSEAILRRAEMDVLVTPPA